MADDFSAERLTVFEGEYLAAKTLVYAVEVWTSNAANSVGTDDGVSH